MIDGGACLESCLGVLLKIPSSDIPFHKGSDWLDRINDYLLETFDLYMVGVSPDNFKPEGLTIAVYSNPDGKNDQEKTHAVLFKDPSIVFDPSLGRWFAVPGNKRLDHFLLIVNFYSLY